MQPPLGLNGGQSLVDQVDLGRTTGGRKGLAKAGRPIAGLLSSWTRGPVESQRQTHDNLDRLDLVHQVGNRSDRSLSSNRRQRARQ